MSVLAWHIIWIQETSRDDITLVFVWVSDKWLYRSHSNGYCHWSIYMYMHTIRLPLSIIQGSKKPKPNNNLSFGEYPLFAMTTHMYNDTISMFIEEYYTLIYNKKNCKQIIGSTVKSDWRCHSSKSIVLIIFIRSVIFPCIHSFILHSYSIDPFTFIIIFIHFGSCRSFTIFSSSAKNDDCPMTRFWKFSFSRLFRI